jgi:hypothetical protein
MNKKSPIDRAGGLKPYLDGLKDVHDGHGYDDLVTYVRAQIGISGIARLFKVYRGSVIGWLHKLDKRMLQSEHDKA